VGESINGASPPGTAPAGQGAGQRGAAAGLMLKDLPPIMIVVAQVFAVGQTTAAGLRFFSDAVVATVHLD
jgi:hypothetical protein